MRPSALIGTAHVGESFVHAGLGCTTIPTSWRCVESAFGGFGRQWGGRACIVCFLSRRPRSGWGILGGWAATVFLCLGHDARVIPGMVYR